ncbi:MAG: cobyric acid synthase [Lachnospiraceae bacterium]|nr:cobyric acid synthase [Lachnospiraceae bacterium]
MAKSIMIQGTMSNVGKSLLVGALCRIFHQDGYKTAPFKSQNMALNSYITKEGLEMGRAQVMQAEAAGIEPSAVMNPILLKPTNDTGSQIIINGEVVGTMSAVEYYQKKKQFVPMILDAYHKLEEQYDIIVIEGAGSPAEINLKEHDIVNMGMAKMAKAPVLLAGDIDRGGVFAQLLGTISLLTKEEQCYVKGMVINKFRGDKKILQPGIDMLEERAKIPVLGVVPYLYLDIDDEDSLSGRFAKKETAGLVDIVVIRVPRISNFTDFNVFECMDEVSLRYVSTAEQLGNPDMILLPGSKNTIGDLLWMRQNGMEARILQQAKAGRIIFGVCGGYQMLGETISDPEGLEQRGTVRGMGLLPIHTIFQTEKARRRVTGHFGKIEGKLKSLSGVQVEGYEIHMGTSQRNGSVKELTRVVNTLENGEEKIDGAQEENVYGSYVHGIFDAPEVAKTIVAEILKEKGLDSSKVTSFHRKEYKESQYDALADAVRSSCHMEQIYRIMDKGIT